MSDKLQQAIQATRVGDKKNAQFLLTQAIQEEPDNPQSWYLLSLLVDDKAKQEAYLTKVLDLDPYHLKAHEKLIAISEPAVPKPESIAAFAEDETEASPIILSSNSSDLEAQDEGKTLPDWMADDLPDSGDDTTAEMIETAVTVEEEAVPDWLQGSVDGNWDQDETKTAVPEIAGIEAATKEDKKPQEKTVAVKEKKPASPQKSNETNLNYMLIGLVAIAVIVFFILAYLIFTMM